MEIFTTFHSQVFLSPVFAASTPCYFQFLSFLQLHKGYNTSHSLKLTKKKYTVKHQIRSASYIFK